MLLKDILNPLYSFRNIWPNRGLLWQWAVRLLEMRYTGAFLGYIWSIATPLLMLAVYTFVFGLVFKARWNMLDPTQETTGSFAVILFCGMAIFHIFSETVMGSARCVIDNPNLVKKVIFPLQILPLAQMMASFIEGHAWFGLVIFGALVAGIIPGLCAFLFPLVLVPLMLLSVGIGWFVAATTVYLRDIPHVVGMFLQVLFFMTPIFYPETMVPKNLIFILEWNPLTWLVRQGRDLLLFNHIPPWQQIIGIWLVCGAIYQLGFVWFMKVKKGFADVL